MVVDFNNLFKLFCNSYVESLPKHIQKLIGVKESLEEFCDSLVGEFEALVKSYRENRKEFERRVEKLGVFFYRRGIEISFIIDALSSLTSKILLYFHSEKFPPSFDSEVLNFFYDFPNLLSRGYIKESIKVKKEFFYLKFPKEDYLKGVNWTFEVLESSFNGKFPDLKNLDEGICPLNKVLQSNAYRLSCKKLNLCSLSEELHRKIHSDLISYTSYLMARRYLPAYLVLLDIYVLLFRFFNVVKSVDEHRKSITLDEVVEFLVDEVKEPFYLFILDPKDISFINKTLGYSVGDEIFEFLLDYLEGKFKRESGKDFAVFKCPFGVVAAFFRKGESSDEEIVDRFKKAFDFLNSALSLRFSTLPVPIKLNGFVLKVDKGFPMKKDDLLTLIKFVLRSVKIEGRFKVFDFSDFSLQGRVRSFSKLINFIKDITKNGYVKLAVQGIRDLRSGEVHHYEVLSRFVDQDRIIPAYQVIDLFYEFRLIHILDTLVFGKIAENVEAFLSLGKPIYVNLSLLTVKNPGAKGKIVESISEVKSKGLKIGIEITEQAAVGNFETLIDFVSEVDVPVSIDDFGTGYSSFSKLIDFVDAIPVDSLKIDGSYVKKISESPKAKSVVKAINSMAHALNLKTIAEFVENEKLVDELMFLDVDFGQGYYFSKPEILV